MADWYKYCDRCGDRQLPSDVKECRHFDCPMKNPVVDVGDELHKILGEALALHEGGKP